MDSTKITELLIKLKLNYTAAEDNNFIVFNPLCTLQQAHGISIEDALIVYKDMFLN
jgi:hypothetical protein